jgi:hypothetical protein
MTLTHEEIERYRPISSDVRVQARLLTIIGVARTKVISTKMPIAAGRLKLTSSAIMPVRIFGSPNFGFRAAIVLGVSLAIAPTPVFAEIQVGGSPEAVTIEVRDASVEEVLATLSRRFGMDYHSSIDLDKRLDGTYVGPLSQVVTRILEGYNFFLQRKCRYHSSWNVPAPRRDPAAGATARAGQVG